MSAQQISDREIIIYQHEELEWLVSLLFTKKFWKRHGDGHVSIADLQNIPTPTEYCKKIAKALANNENAQRCIKEAMEAMQRGEIEVYKIEPRDIYDDVQPTNEPVKVWTASFMLWAKRQKYKISKEIIDSIQLELESYVRRLQNMEKLNYWFPALSQEKFELLKKQPLWRISTGIIFLMERYSNKSPEQEIELINQSPEVKKFCDYIHDAAKTGALELLNYDVEGDAKKQIQVAEVEPLKLIEWAKTLPLDIPILNSKPSASPISQRERDNLLRIIFVLARETFKADNHHQWKHTVLGDKIYDFASDISEMPTGRVIGDKIKDALEIVPQGAVKKK